MKIYRHNSAKRMQFVLISSSILLASCGGGSNSPATTPESPVSNKPAQPTTPTTPSEPEQPSEPITPHKPTESEEEVIVDKPASKNGSISTQKVSFSPNVTTACDSKWTMRILGIHRSRQLLPNHIYTASCQPHVGQPKMFTSLTVKKGDTQSGMIIESQMDDNGNMVPTGVTREFAECKEMHGISASDDCSVVGALCRREGGASDAQNFTKDMVASIPDANKRFRDWITQADRDFDEEWLYDWNDGDISKSPNQYVANKAIGNWELGKQDLVYSTNQDAYGLSLEAAVGSHDGDSFLVVERNDFSINPNRGWLWACGAGHTLMNHATYNPATGKFAAICATDLGVTDSQSGGYGGLWVKVEQSGKGKGFLSFPVIKQNYAGGVTSMLPLADGGYVGVVAGSEATQANQEYREVGPTTKIGIAKFDAYGALVGDINWIVTDNDWFYSYPQIASLGDGKYLLGYAKMVQLSKREAYGPNVYGDAIRLPESFHVMEVDVNGQALTSEQTVQYGWGEQDRMVSLEAGKVAWSYIPNAQYTPEGSNKSLPGCNIDELALNVYSQQ